MLEQAEVDPAGVDVGELAEFAGPDEFADALHRRVVDVGVIDPEHQLSRLGEHDEFLGVRCGGGEWFLNEHVLPGLEGRLGEGVMRRNRRGQHEGGDIGPAQSLGERGQALRPGIFPESAGEALRVLFDNDDRGERAVQKEITDKFGPPVTVTNDGDAWHMRKTNRLIGRSHQLGSSGRPLADG